MKWAFIDYENVGTLAKIDLSLYERAFVFMGAKQPRLDFGETKYEYPMNIQIIQIAISQNNNLDFHLAYYLGKTNVEAPAGVVFEVISNDNFHYAASFTLLLISFIKTFLIYYRHDSLPFNFIVIYLISL